MLLNFAFLFALIWLFDRKRDDLDAFTIATAVIVPGIIVFLFRLTRMFFEWGLWGEVAELGILVAGPPHFPQVSQFEPLPREVVDHGPGFFIGDHALDLLAQHRRLTERTGLGKRE